jgi:23S rRNA (guanosine2251-2'-O)-methyltransferase
MRGGAKADSSEWLYGIIPVAEAIRAGRRRVLELWMSPSGNNRRLRELREMAWGIPIHDASPKELERRSRGGVHQGIIARVAAFPWSDLRSLLDGEGPLLMLDGIQDPHNLGAILRSSVALGAQGVVVEERRSAALSGVVAKAACGALEYVNLSRVANLPRALGQAKAAGFWVVGARENGGLSLWDGGVPERVTVVVGGEGFGIRPIVGRACDLWVSIPSEGPIRTYNASVAAALILYELMRGREKRARAGKTG